jgi:Lar family restriction alleviation protein
MTEPLPCPFCGQTEITFQWSDGLRWVMAVCKNCGASACEVRSQTSGDGTLQEWREFAEQRALKEWNTRAHGVI